MTKTKKKEIPPQQANKGSQAVASQVNTIVIQKPKIEILVGGPYKLNGEEHNYGHTALRVTTNNIDIIYDFGRYGKTWGTGDSEGEGVLNVWDNFQKYIAAENSLGRKTSGFVYNIEAQKADLIIKWYQALIEGGKLMTSRSGMKRYKIQHDYHALSFNCTTISLDGARRGIEGIDAGSAKFIEGRSLKFSEKLASRAVGWPNKLFMPADLHAFLTSKKDTVKINEYKNK
ncbi:hypothetical protein [Iodobacter ciconiae]|uniref:Uncharacterized protein n=1 Tax=Iodobacter ciconiae TaxID=2496266 RepID=A0A3S8ZP93_9NEIS|nr:hypothetical protein [Iodobacter ciconiae]AZN35251.1 hypothetical protein EJO50_01350 [Iodobacter ciconiae]